MSERGGALLEAVLALGIAAMLAAAVAQVGRFGLEALNRAGGRQAEVAGDLAERRALAGLLSRIDAPRPGAPSFAGDERRMTWRGVAPAPDGGWEGGFWRLEAADDALTLLKCDALDGACAPVDRFAAVDGFAYAAADGGFAAESSAGAPPALIRLGDTLVVHPRVAGAAR